MNRWVLIQHVEFEGPGLIAELAADCGIALDVHRMDLGEALPSGEQLDGLGGLIVLGGPMSAHDDGDYPHLAAERKLLASGVERGLPVLGVCLGAQLLAAALGARVYRGPVPEIGLGTVTLTVDGLADPVLGCAGPQVPVLHWHSDTFDLPAGATRLASTPDYPNQAFRFGQRAYGLQFHVEVHPGLLDSLAPHLPADVQLDRPQAGAVEKTGRTVLRRFFTLRPT